MFGFGKKKEKVFLMPLSGNIIDLSKVEDPVFSQKMMGDGFAIEPTSGKVYAPFDGEVISIFPTGHAVGLKSNDGVEVLIHVGLDTVQLNGEGFVKCVEEGSKVKAGDLLIDVDLDSIKGKVPSIVTPVIFTNTDTKFTVEYKTVEAKEKGVVVVK